MERYRRNGGNRGVWLVDWDPAMKVRLQTESEKGILLVRFDGDELTVLRGCELPGAYRFTPSSKIKNREHIRSQTELFAKLPLGAVSLGAEFTQGDLWSMDYVMVGSRDASISEVSLETLREKCRQATHFVQGMVVGAVRLSTASSLSGGGAAGAFKAGVGGGHVREAAVIREEGDFDACAKSGAKEIGKGCHATVKLFLEPVRGARPAPETSPSPPSTIDLGTLTFPQNDLVFFPHFVIPDRGIATMELESDLPRSIQKQWGALMREEATYREILMKRVTRLSEIDGNRRACLSLRHGCTIQHVYAEQDAAANQVFDRRISVAKQSLKAKRHRLEMLLRRELSSRLKQKRDSDPAAVALAGILLAIAHDAALEGDDARPDFGAVPSEITTLLEGVVDSTGPATAAGWWSRYLLAAVRLQSGDEPDGISMLEAIADERWRPETVQVLFVLGNHHLEVERDPKAAYDSFLQMAEAARKFENHHAFGVASVLAGLCAFYMERYAESLAIAISAIGDQNQRSLHVHLTALAAECVEHLGGIEKETLDTAPPAVFAAIANILARRALSRHGIAEAAAAWHAILERAPDSIHAAFAVEGLIAVAQRDGDTATAYRLEKMRAARFAIESEWAAGLRAARNKDGAPTDEEISRAVGATPPPLPPLLDTDMDHRQDFIAKLDGLFSHCLASAGYREPLFAEFVITTQGTGKGTVTTTFKPVKTSAKNRAAEMHIKRCMERDAARYLAGVERRFRATLKTQE